MPTLEVPPSKRPKTKAHQITAPLRSARLFDQAMAFVMDNARMDRQERCFLIASVPDEQLISLASRLNAIGNDVSTLRDANDDAARELSWNNLRFDLGNLAAFALVWSTPNHPDYQRGCKAIATERLRQKDLLRKFPEREAVASPATDNRAKFCVLFEECGEVAEAIDQIKNHGMAAGNLPYELTHVAAVCVAWLESLEGEGR